MLQGKLWLSKLSLWIVAATLVACSAAGAAAPAKVALLVGINKYEKRGLSEKVLSYAERDVDELAAELKKHGFEVRLLKGSSTRDDRADKKNIDAALAKLLEGRNADDIILVGLAGHGSQMPLVDDDGRPQTTADGKGLEDAYFLPTDAVLGDARTLVSLTKLMQTLDRRGGINLVLCDACRDNPDAGRSARSITGNELNGRLPANTAIVFGCAAGQQAQETKEAGGGHGVFFYHVLEGLRGKAASDGEVTWSSLVSYVRKNTNARAKQWFPEQAQREATRRQTPLDRLGFQTPHELRNLVDEPVLAHVSVSPKPKPDNDAEPKLGDVLSNSIGMKLVYVPAGKYEIGAQPDDVDANPDEKLHTVTLSKPFYIGMHEVTLQDCSEVLTRVELTPAIRQWPVTNFARATAEQFCQRLGDLTPERDAQRSYRLPTEAEWEACCRGGTKTAYSTGSKLRDAHCRLTTETALKAKTTVGSYAPNPFGLFDMHGNVAEWCADDYAAYTGDAVDPHPRLAERPGKTPEAVIRGGSFLDTPDACRSAYRDHQPATKKLPTVGFRVVMQIEE